MRERRATQASTSPNAPKITEKTTANSSRTPTASAGLKPP